MQEKFYEMTALDNIENIIAELLLFPDGNGIKFMCFDEVNVMQNDVVFAACDAYY